MAPRTIRTIRTSIGLSQSEFAKVLGYETNTVAKWESGNAKPSRRAVAAIRKLGKKR